MSPVSCHCQLVPGAGCQTAFPDYVAPSYGALAILAALHFRARTGKGQYIDLSEQEAAVPVMGAALLEYQMTGRIPERMGDRSAYAAPQGCYRCAGEDRWAVISCANDAEFERLAAAMGHAEWLDDPRFATVLARFEHQVEHQI